MQVTIVGAVPLTARTRQLLTEQVIDGVNIFFAPGGYFLIIHVMQFPWDEHGAPKHGIGATDTELIKQWPGLQFDNTRDYILLGFAGAAQNLPADILHMNDQQGDPIHKPVIGRLVLAAMRTGMRIVNHLPPLKRRMAASQRAYRGHDRDQ
ncbi:MAG TPA: hypothetical protein VIY28_17040 [Pseudonocardiaceae bacterium]